MYIPSFNRIDDEAEIRRLVAAARSAEFITVDEDGFPVATLLPIMWDGSRGRGPYGEGQPAVEAITRDSPALLICSAPEAYISPSWYASKNEHGRVVPDVELQRGASDRDGAGERGPGLAARCGNPAHRGP